eukprot:4744550-Pyramimonas_sp.AAC.1
MAVDCLTKDMPTDFLVKILRTSSYDVTPDLESTLKEVQKQLARARANAIPSGKFIETSGTARSAGLLVIKSH